jgi:phosphoglucosamine mutase
VFSGRGEKFTERVEREVEAIVGEQSWHARSGEAMPVPTAALAGPYLEHLRAVIPEAATLAGVKVAIDCANGATTTVAPELFRGLGLDLVVIGNHPDGRNINLRCGSTHPERLAQTVAEQRCEVGVAFDGDGDRAIFVDHSGRIVNGDAVLLMCARQLQREGRLKGNAVVATVMSNIGLELALSALGIALVRCPVGDKYVMEEMLARDLSLGGEQSGHIIFSEYLFTGDGLCTALNVLRTMALAGRRLAELAADLVAYPQVLLNVRVREKTDLQTVPAVAAAISRVEGRVAGQGRLLVRYSGTEPLLRVMLEGRNEDEIRTWAQEIVDVVQKELG